ncbi:MAG: hypothetical protein C4520_09630 [Candidatus Abyssobacteria bacterium SURF_5]|uniref:Uncharacterized protein n=1 Tax=Abyssobacteria bacterium (strain SURF_5) TaxID=2093360 RepID=A0A3A4NWP3_ABYX5|nr:MAG: hypothetical protein C4520_09630 [Candidatus Abyssubacteria bacterium SURF_5]
MFEKGSPLRVSIDIGGSGVRELHFVGKVVIDAEDFMAIQFDTIILPKMEIKSADQIPDKPLEEVLGTEISASDAVKRLKPPKVENVRFIQETVKKKAKS